MSIYDDLARFYDDPLNYVRYIFPWGEGMLEGKTIRSWQAEFLTEIGNSVKSNTFDGINAVPPILRAVRSGHGIGKSALTSWIIKWIMDTRPYAKGVVTANTGDQLKTKTWAELSKWHNMSLTKNMFEYHNSRGNMCLFNKDHVETWRCDALPNREESSESFAGLHAANSTPFYIFDEASNISDTIFNVAQGGLTDGEPMCFCFGNPTR